MSDHRKWVETVPPILYRAYPDHDLLPIEPPKPGETIGAFKRRAEQAGDTLFLFLCREADDEIDAQEYLNRLDRAVRDIAAVRNAVARWRCDQRLVLLATTIELNGAQNPHSDGASEQGATNMSNEQNKSIRIVIYVDGGIVQDVLADAPGVEAMVVDYDNEKAGEPKASRSFDPVEVNRQHIEKTIKGIEE